MTIDELKEYLTDRKKFCVLMAKISLVAAIVFIAYGWLVVVNTQMIVIGMFFMICFFGFWYGKQKITKVEQERTFFGTQPDAESHLPKLVNKEEKS